MQISKVKNDSQSFGYNLVYGDSAKKIPANIRAIIKANEEIARTIGDNKKIYIGVSSYGNNHLDLYLPTGFPMGINESLFPWEKQEAPIYQIVRTVTNNMYDDPKIETNLIAKLKKIANLYNKEAARYAKNTKQDINAVKAIAQPKSWEC